MLKIILKWWLGRHRFRFKFKGIIGCSSADTSTVSFYKSMLIINHLFGGGGQFI